MNAKVDHEFAEDAGLGFEDSDGFHWFEPQQIETAQERIEKRAEIVADDIELAAFGTRVAIAKMGWKSINENDLLTSLPYVENDTRNHYRPPYQIEDKISAICKANWRTVWSSRPRYGGDSVTTIAYATVSGIEIMRISNGFDYEPYYIREA